MKLPNKKNLKIVVAPDSFKGSLTALEACSAIAAGVRKVVPDARIVEIPMADGGEGTIDALVESTGGRYERLAVTGPIGEKVRACYGILGGSIPTAVIEMASAAGLPLVPNDKRCPLETTTFGLGELIVDALDKGCRNFIIGIGGSATNDCGTGMAQALGVRFFDEVGDLITEPMNGRLCGEVACVDFDSIDPRIADSRVTVACDVTNPLLGVNGASFTYAPQKGADAEEVKVLDQNMAHVIELIEARIGRKVRDIAGAGAAGGLGAGLVAFTNAIIEPGIDIVMRYSRFEEKICDSDLIITGEGMIDATTIFGKTISGIAAIAKKNNVPVIALAGAAGPGSEKVSEIGVTSIWSICSDSVTVRQSIENASLLLADTAERAMRSIIE